MQILRSLNTSNGTHIYDPSLQMLEKLSVPCITHEDTWFLLLFTRVRWDQKYDLIFAQFSLSSYGREKMFYATLRVLNYSPPYNTYSQTQADCYSIVISLEVVLINCILLSYQFRYLEENPAMPCHPSMSAIYVYYG